MKINVELENGLLADRFGKYAPEADRLEGFPVRSFPISIEGVLTAATVAIASGENFPDALAGGALLGSRAGVLLLSPTDDASSVATWLSSRKDQVKKGYLLGGTGTLSANVAKQIETALQ